MLSNEQKQQMHAEMLDTVIALANSLRTGLLANGLFA